MKRLLSALLLMLSSTAFAYTECSYSIRQIYTGDSSMLFLFFVGGGSTIIPAAEQKNVLSIALTAYTTGKNVWVRYAADNTPCTTDFTNNSFRGIWLGNPG